jgi:hypothetical protein
MFSLLLWLSRLFQKFISFAFCEVAGWAVLRKVLLTMPALNFNVKHTMALANSVLIVGNELDIISNYQQYKMMFATLQSHP